MKKSLLKNNGVQSLIASLLCIVLGMLIGYIVLLFINPTGAGEAIVTVMKNFLNYNRADTQLKYLCRRPVRRQRPGGCKRLFYRRGGHYHQRHHAELDHAVYRQYDPG